MRRSRRDQHPTHGSDVRIGRQPSRHGVGKECAEDRRVSDSADRQRGQDGEHAAAAAVFNIIAQDAEKAEAPALKHHAERCADQQR
jgi:hypothetical protein